MTDWPRRVTPVAGMAPGELRLLEKVSGAPLDQLDQPDQLKASVFCALLRWYRDHHSGELPDAGEVWEQAEWTEAEPPGDTSPLALLNPPDAAG
jgi:hypothetical protein